MQFSDKEENYRLILIFGPPLRTINRGKDLAEWKNGATFVPGKLAEWSIAAVLKTVDCHRSGGSNPSLSAELTGQKWSVNGQKATNQRFVAFFIARKSSFQDFKSTVKDKVSLLNRYLFPAGQKR